MRLTVSTVLFVLMAYALGLWIGWKVGLAHMTSKQEAQVSAVTETCPPYTLTGLAIGPTVPSGTYTIVLPLAARGTQVKLTDVIWECVERWEYTKKDRLNAEPNTEPIREVDQVPAP